MLDTTMAFTPFIDEAGAPFPPAELPRLRDLGDRVLLGTDFPNIPYTYADALEALETHRTRPASGCAPSVTITPLPCSKYQFRCGKADVLWLSFPTLAGARLGLAAVRILPSGRVCVGGSGLTFVS